MSLGKGFIRKFIQLPGPNITLKLFVPPASVKFRKPLMESRWLLRGKLLNLTVYGCPATRRVGSTNPRAAVLLTWWVSQ